VLGILPWKSKKCVWDYHSGAEAGKLMRVTVGDIAAICWAVDCLFYLVMGKSILISELLAMERDLHRALTARKNRKKL
jgi:hypothetical protein